MVLRMGIVVEKMAKRFISTGALPLNNFHYSITDRPEPSIIVSGLLCIK